MTAPPAPAVVATTEQVAVAWLRSLGFNAGTTLPRDLTGWQASGFVQVAASGGSSSIYVPMRSPVVRLDCWAANPTSGKPPWGRANAIAEAIRGACLNHPTFPVALTLVGTPAPRARVHSAYLAGEPIRVLDDVGSYARYSFPLALWWTPL